MGTTTKHTPGPWEYFEAKTQDMESTYGIRGNAQFIATIDVVAIGNGPFLCPENGEANARLIAAAPELLDFAQEMVEYLNLKLDGWQRVDQLPDNHAIVLTAKRYLAQARAAIAKATGDAT